MRKGFRMRNWKRAVSILLVFMMVLTTVYSDLGGAWVDVKSVQAEEDDPQTDSTQEAPSEDTSEDASSETSRMITLSVGEGDARSLQLTTAGTFDNAVSVNYGQTFAIQVQAEEEQQVDIYYASKDISEENIGNIDKWSQYDSDSRESCPSAVGDYYIGYKIGEQVHLSNQYGFSIKKATIGAPSTVTIDDDYNVSFSAVTSTTDGVAIEESSVTYELKLLKAAAEGEEASVIAQTSLPEPATAETPWNVASQIRTAGEGSYYVTVTPVLSEQARESYTVPETSTAQSESVSFADTTIPVIESYTANQEQFQLQAKVKDSESSVVAYVFTTKTSVDDIGDDEWQAITGNTAGEVAEVSATPTASGTYYFYAKDAAGNKVSSVAGEAIEVTKVTLKEIYEDNATQATQRDLAVFGSGEYTLPTPTREGFQFLGWKKTLESDETIDSITPAQEDITVIATWKDIREKVTIQPVDDETVTVTDSSVQKTYDGTALTLISSLANVPEDTEVSYQWYKNGVALDGKTDSTINVKNVSGSGTYTVVATITKNDAPFTFGSNEIVVTINPVQLTVKAGDHAISYLSDAPTNENYTYTVTGFVNNETEDVLNVDGLEYACTYQKGNAAGTECAITPAGLSANHGNYTFDYQPGTLRVNVKAVSVAQPNGVNLTLDSASLVYDGTEKRPNVTVTDEQLGDDSALSATRDYTVAYTDNVNASSNKATVTVTFCGNYTGTLKQTFDIEKATPVISVEVEADHEYDNVAPTVTPTITNSSGEAPTYRYYKVVGENVTALSSAPRAAGNYQIEASLKEQANYNAVTSDRVFYTIRPRDITLESPDGNWPYDEGEHLTSAIYPDVSGKLQRYKMTGSFIGSDGFQSVTVPTRVTNVCTVTNTIEYELSSSTTASNYNIIKHEGRLTITANPLPAPGGRGWDSKNPGRATWIAISRKNLEVKYKVSLYRALDNARVGEPKTTTNTYVDFANEIKYDAVNRMNQNPSVADLGQSGYYFVVSVSPTGGTNKDNYADSNNTNYDPQQETTLSEEEQGKSGNLYTTIVEATYGSHSHDSLGVARASINVTNETVTVGGQSVSVKSTVNGKDRVLLIQGESATIGATSNPGYALEPPIWESSKSQVTIANARVRETTIKAVVTNAPIVATVYAHAKDENPIFSDVEYTAAVTDSNRQTVTLHFTATDSLGITGYYVAKKDETPTLESTGWHNYTNENGETVQKESITEEVTINQSTMRDSETFYIWLKDNGGNLVKSSKGITVYKISFANGGGEVMSGKTALQPVLKVEQQPFTLPENVYKKAGSSFKNWKGQKGILYANGDAYVLDKSDTLTPEWSEEQYEYTIQYYDMNPDGTYPATATRTKAGTGKYGVSISYDAAYIQDVPEGMELDRGATYQNTLTIGETAAENIVKVYYARKTYTVTYKWNSVDGTQSYTETISVRYGQAITEHTAPTISGYNFVGWVYDPVGNCPDAMPDHNLTATGHYEAKDVTYKVAYYWQDIPESASSTPIYRKVSEVDTKTAKYNAVISATTDMTAESVLNQVKPRTFDGYTVSAVGFSNGVLSESDTVSDTESSTIVPTTTQVTTRTSASTDGEPEVYINYFYTRNQYTFTLNVVKGQNTEPKYTHSWTYYYGQELSQEQITANVNDGQSSWENIPGYTVSEEVIWNCGTQPSSMPAGDVIATREYKRLEEKEYTINVYVEEANAIDYSLVGTYTGIGLVNSTVRVDSSAQSGETTGTDTVINPELYKTTVPELEYYTYNSANSHNTANNTGVQIASNGSTEINLYYERKTYDVPVNVYVYDDNGGVQIGTYNISGVKWGHTIEVNPFDIYNNGLPDNFVTTNLSGDERTNFSQYQRRNNDSEPNPLKKVDGQSSSFVVYYTGQTRTCTSSGSGSSRTVNYSFQYPFADYTTADVDANTKRITHTVGMNYRNAGGSTDYNSNYINLSYVKVTSSTAFTLDINYSWDQVARNSKVGGINTLKEKEENLEGSLYVAPATEAADETNYVFAEPTNSKKKGLRIINLNAVEHNSEYTKIEGLTFNGSPMERQNATYLKDYSGTRSDPGNITYYKKTVDDGYIYIADPFNRLNRGSLLRLDSNDGCLVLPRAVSDAYIVNYKQKHGDAEGVAEADIDSHRTGIVYTNASYRSILSAAPGATNATRKFTYRYSYSDFYHFIYNLNGTNYADATKEYAPNDIAQDLTQEDGPRVTPTTHFNDDLEANHQGYQIVWYTDSNKETRLEDTEKIKMTGNKVIYGQYEYKIHKSHEVKSYELANPVTIADGTQVRYVTSANLEAVKQALGEEQSVTEDTPTYAEESYVTEHNKTRRLSCKTVTYRLNGEVIMVDREIPTIAFNNANITDYATTTQAGYRFDGTSQQNCLSSYVDLNPVVLVACYARDRYKITKDDNNVENGSATPEIIEYPFGQTVDLQKPEYEGYNFAGWEWKESVTTHNEETGADTTQLQPITVTPGVQEHTIVMPSKDIHAIAKWTPKTEAREIIYYYQAADQSYKDNELQYMRTTSNVEDTETISLITIDNTEQRAGKKYAAATVNGKAFPGGVSFEEEGRTYYYQCDVSGELRVGAGDLIAVVANKDFTTKADFTVKDSDYNIAEEVYQYNYAVMRKAGRATMLQAKERVTSEDGASIERDRRYQFEYGSDFAYYYTRDNNYNITVVGKSIDGGENTGVSILGAGGHYYGENVTLVASVAPGYEIQGWYKAEDVLNQNQTLKEDITTVTPLAQNTTSLPIVVTKQETYVVVTRPISIGDVQVKIPADLNTETAEGNVIYGYGDKTISAVVEGLGVADSIESYEWFECSEQNGVVVETQITGVSGCNSANLQFVRGKNAGTYTYKCKVKVKQRDNGRVKTFTSDPYHVVVKPKAIGARPNHYTGTYDGSEHTGTITVPVDASKHEKFRVYYSTDVIDVAHLEEVPSYTTDAVRSLPKFKDVKATRDGVESYLINYYVQGIDEEDQVDETGNPIVGSKTATNYLSETGVVKVTINPKQLSIEPITTAKYSKEYDGETLVGGALSDSTSDKYRLGNGTGNLYRIEGFLATEQTQTYLLDFTAHYNDAHVSNAKFVTLNDMWIVSSLDPTNTNFNYKFPPSAQLRLSGEITRKSITATWNEANGKEYIYDGEEHSPDLTQTQVAGVASDGMITLERVSQPQVNVNTTRIPTYTATASVASSRSYQLTDYVLTGASRTYRIAKRQLTVKPNDETVTYDGADHKLGATAAAYTVDGFDTFKQKGYTYTIGATSTAQSAGIYSKGGASEARSLNMQILSGATNVTGNFEITYQPGTLTITKRKIKVSGIQVANKVYDGTSDVANTAINVDHVTFALDETVSGSAIIGNDQVNLDSTKITATYIAARDSEEPSSSVGTNTVKLSFGDGVLTGSAAANYELVIDDCDPYVTSAITPKALTVTPKVDNEVDLSASTRGIIYGQKPEFSYEATGFEHAENTSVIQGNVTYRYKKHDAAESTYQEYDPSTTKLDAGTYDVQIVTSGEHAITADNYTITSATTTLVVAKREVNIKAKDGVNITKTYDATLDATVAATDYDFVGSNEANTKGLVDGDVIRMSGHQEVYDNKNVTYSEPLSGASKVIVSNVTIDNPNYRLVNTTFDIPGTITKAELLVTADDQTINYGDAVPQYTVTYGDGENGKDFVTANGSREAFEDGKLTYTCSYAANNAAGTYDIEPVVAGDSDVAKNYNIVMKKGTLTVNPIPLTTPTVTWKTGEENLGKVEWTAVPAIGNVSVDKYEVTLYKNGTPIATKLVDSDVTTYDFEAEMRNTTGEDESKLGGAGAYEVSVVAKVATGTTDVSDSVAGKTADKRYAANVMITYEDSEGKGETTFIKNEGSDRYLMIAGEREVPFTVSRTNVTGYSFGQPIVKRENALCTDLTFATMQNEESSPNYSDKVSLSDALVSDKPIVIVMQLNKTPATVDGTISSNKTEIEYGYSSRKAPNLTVTARPEDRDNVTADKYTYQYNWSYRNTAETADVRHSFGEDSATAKLMDTRKLTAGEYEVYCTITATRSDNNKTISKEVKLTEQIRILAYPMGDTIVELDDWVYGNERKAPVVSGYPSDAGVDVAQITYQYRDTTNETEEWSDQIPTDVGVYELKATVNSRYAPVEVYDTFEIKKPTLKKAEQVTFRRDANYKLSNLSWDAVTKAQYEDGDEIKETSSLAENAEREGRSDSSLKIAYEVHLYEKNVEALDSNANLSDTTVWSEVILPDSYKKLDEPSVALGEYMTNATTYQVAIKTIVIEDETCKSQRSNCVDSDFAYGTVQMEYTLVPTDTLTQVDEATKTISKVYSKEGCTLKVERVKTATDREQVSYQWRKNGEIIAGATQSTYKIKHVSDSGVYSCDVIVEGNQNPITTVSQQVTILPRKVVVTADSKEKVYDKQPLVADTFRTVQKGHNSNDEDGYGLLDGDEITVEMTGSITDAGVAVAHINKIKTFTSTEDESVYQMPADDSDTVDTSENDYVFTFEDGSLTVRAAELTSIELSETAYVYDGVSIYEPTYTVYAKRGNQTEPSVLTNEDEVSYEITSDSVIKTDTIGTYKITAKGIGNYSGTVVATYTVKDNKNPVITNVVADQIYCINRTFTVEDLLLSTVTVNGQPAVETEESKAAADATKKTYNLPASDTAYEIVAKDTSGNTTTISNVKVNKTHTWSYNVSESLDSAEAFCVIDTCDTYKEEVVENHHTGFTVSIAAEGGMYTGAKYEATVTKSDSFDEAKAAKDAFTGYVSDVVYYEMTGDGAEQTFTKLDAAPSKAGTYRAVVKIAQEKEALSEVTSLATATKANPVQIMTEFTITPIEITADNSETVIPEQKDFVADGTPKTLDNLEVKVKVDGEEVTLKEGEDYEVVYTNNVEPGTATAKVIGIGNYSGVITETTFDIATNSGGVDGYVDGEETSTFTVRVKQGSLELNKQENLPDTSYFKMVDLADGEYNLVVEEHFSDDTYITETWYLSIVNGEIVHMGTLSVGKKQTIAEVHEGAPNVAVENLDSVYKKLPQNVLDANVDDTTIENTINEGGNVKVILTVKVPQSQTVLDRIDAFAKKKSFTRGTTFDAYLNLHITPNGQETKSIVIKEAQDLILLAMPLAETDKNKGSYTFVRSHLEEGETEEQLTELSVLVGDERVNPTNEGYYLSGAYAYIWAKKFSTYALLYGEKTATDTSSDNDKNTENENTKPKTDSKQTQSDVSAGDTVGTTDAPNTTTEALATSDDAAEQARLNKKNNLGYSINDIIRELKVEKPTAEKIYDVGTKEAITLDTLKIDDAFVTEKMGDEDVKGSDFGRLKGRAIKCKPKQMTLKWTKQKGADGYKIFGSQCNTGKKIIRKYKLMKIVGKNKRSLVVKKLKKATYYKFFIVAYKNIDGKKITIASTVTIHSATTTGKYGVAKAVKLTKVGKGKSSKVKTTTGKTVKVKATEIRQIKNKPIRKHRKLAFESSNPKVIKVGKFDGKLKAVGKGKCSVWVYAQNGVYKTIKVTVK